MVRRPADHPLASNFSILDGWVTVTVPDVTPGTDYTIVRGARVVLNLLNEDEVRCAKECGNMVRDVREMRGGGSQILNLRSRSFRELQIVQSSHIRCNHRW